PGQPHFRTGIVSKVVGAWQVNGIMAIQRGMPIVISGPNTANLPGLTSRADRLRSGAHGSGRTRDHWFDTSAFVSAAAYSLGSDSRTEPDLRAPGLRNLDFSVMRNQVIRERTNVQ